MLITIPGQPVHKVRARITKRGNYDPQHDLKQWYRAVLLAELRKYLNSDEKEKVMIGSNLARSRAFDVSMYFYFAPPDSWPQKRKKAALCGKLKHTQKPDLDNLEKFILDCASGILYPDDKAIVTQTSLKAYADFPRTVLEITGDNALLSTTPP